MALEIFTLRERPDLRPLISPPNCSRCGRNSPGTMRQQTCIMDHRCWIAILDYAFTAMIDGKVVGRAFSVPFAFNIDGRTELPDGGWDQVIRWAHDDKMIGRTPTALSALEMSLLPAARGGGNSLALLGAMRACAKARGFAELFAPVRPNAEAPAATHADARLR